MKSYEDAVKVFGWQSEKEAAKQEYWYQEKGIRTLKDVATAVGAEDQYEEDFSHLSGPAHGDNTVFVITHFLNKGDTGYARFVYFKSVEILGSITGISLKIAKKAPSIGFQETWERVKVLSRKIHGSRPNT